MTTKALTWCWRRRRWRNEVEKRGGGGQRIEVSSSDLIAELTKDMLEAADNLEFERAAYLRDQIKELKKRK